MAIWDGGYLGQNFSFDPGIRIIDPLMLKLICYDNLNVFMSFKPKKIILAKFGVPQRAESRPCRNFSNFDPEKLRSPFCINSLILKTIYVMMTPIVLM